MTFIPQIAFGVRQANHLFSAFNRNIFLDHRFRVWLGVAAMPGPRLLLASASTMSSMLILSWPVVRRVLSSSGSPRTSHRFSLVCVTFCSSLAPKIQELMFGRPTRAPIISTDPADMQQRANDRPSRDKFSSYAYRTHHA